MTQDQYDAMKQHAEERQANEGTYDLGRNNCVEFVNDVMRAGGMDGFPGYTTPDQIRWGWALEDFLREHIEGLRMAYAVIRTLVSPIVLDLDGNGVQTIAKGNGTFFDQELDQNGNGRIDSGDAVIRAANRLSYALAGGNSAQTPPAVSRWHP